MKSIAVLGATGDVGRAVVADALNRDWTVLAVGRSANTLSALQEELRSPNLRTVVGSVASEPAAADLANALQADSLDAVVTAVNGPKTRRPMLDWTESDLGEVVRSDLLTHFVAAKAFVRALPAGAVYVGIGGGMADLVVPGFGHSSMIQAAQRMMFRTLSREAPRDGVHVRELIVASMINGRSNRATAPAEWLTAEEIAARVCEIISNPAEQAGPIITMSAGEARSTSAQG